MADIKAADVAKLRRQTGAGMMDCKKALVEAEGDFEVAIDVLRKKGQKVAAKRADREASEGVAITKINSNNTVGIAIVLACETDFVAKNDSFKDLPITIPTVATNVEHNWHKYTIRFKDKETRNKVKKALKNIEFLHLLLIDF